MQIVLALAFFVHYIIYMGSKVLTSKPESNMNATTLNFSTTTTPDFGGFKFYVEAGRLFDADDYADAYKLNRSDIDAQDIHSAQDAAGRLNPGEWLEVTHEVDAE